MCCLRILCVYVRARACLCMYILYVYIYDHLERSGQLLELFLCTLRQTIRQTNKRTDGQMNRFGPVDTHINMSCPTLYVYRMSHVPHIALRIEYAQLIRYAVWGSRKIRIGLLIRFLNSNRNFASHTTRGEMAQPLEIIN